MKMDRPDSRPSRSSILGLDALNFLMADVRDGVGPYLSIYLKGGLHWQSGEIGIAMAVSSITAAICQIPAGLLVDSVRAKRLLVVISGIMVGAGSLLVVCLPKLAVIVAAQATLGAASAVIPPALAALSLGIVGRKLFPARVSRNESFNHGGNFAAAILAGTIGQRFGYQWIFYLVCLFALASAAAVTLIRPQEIDHDMARGGEDKDSSTEADKTKKATAIPIADLFKRRELIIFLASVVLFHLGNAAMLPMAGQVLAKKHPGADIIALSGCIIAAQLVMIGVAAAVGSALRQGVGRKTIFLVAFVTLPIRGILFTLTDSPLGVVGIQLLDGVAAGIFGVISIIIAADLMRGTGRFNFAQGLVALSTGLGAGASNVFAGFVVQAFGYTTGFLALAAIAAGGLFFFASFMSETKPDDSSDEVPSPPATHNAGTGSC
jgi:predicted MFS family arabinose efflux permease